MIKKSSKPELIEPVGSTCSTDRFLDLEYSYATSLICNITQFDNSGTVGGSSNIDLYMKLEYNKNLVISVYDKNIFNINTDAIKEKSIRSLNTQALGTQEDNQVFNNSRPKSTNASSNIDQYSRSKSILNFNIREELLTSISKRSLIKNRKLVLNEEQRIKWPKLSKKSLAGSKPKDDNKKILSRNNNFISSNRNSLKQIKYLNYKKKYRYDERILASDNDKSNLVIEPDKNQTKPDKNQTKPDKNQTKPDKDKTKPDKDQTKPDKDQTKPDKDQTKPDKDKTKPDKDKTKPDIEKQENNEPVPDIDFDLQDHTEALITDEEINKSIPPQTTFGKNLKLSKINPLITLINSHCFIDSPSNCKDLGLSSVCLRCSETKINQDLTTKGLNDLISGESYFSCTNIGLNSISCTYWNSALKGITSLCTPNTDLCKNMVEIPECKKYCYYKEKYASIEPILDKNLNILIYLSTPVILLIILLFFYWDKKSRTFYQKLSQAITADSQKTLNLPSLVFGPLEEFSKTVNADLQPICIPPSFYIRGELVSADTMRSDIEDTFTALSRNITVKNTSPNTISPLDRAQQLVYQKMYETFSDTSSSGITDYDRVLNLLYGLPHTSTEENYRILSNILLSTQYLEIHNLNIESYDKNLINKVSIQFPPLAWQISVRALHVALENLLPKGVYLGTIGGIEAIRYPGDTEHWIFSTNSTGKKSNTESQYEKLVTISEPIPSQFKVLPQKYLVKKADRVLVHAIASSSVEVSSAILASIGYTSESKYHSSFKIRLNGESLSKKTFIERSSFVSNENKFPPDLLVWEALYTAHRNSLNPRSESTYDLVITVLITLRLLDCWNSRVGKKRNGISKIQRKRLAIGMAVMSDVDIFILDNPLLDLDDCSSSNLLSDIKKLLSLLTSGLVYGSSTNSEAINSLLNYMKLYSDDQLEPVRQEKTDWTLIEGSITQNITPPKKKILSATYNVDEESIKDIAALPSLSPTLSLGFSELNHKSPTVLISISDSSQEVLDEITTFTIILPDGRCPFQGSLNMLNDELKSYNWKEKDLNIISRATDFYTNYFPPTRNFCVNTISKKKRLKKKHTFNRLISLHPRYIFTAIYHHYLTFKRNILYMAVKSVFICLTIFSIASKSIIRDRHFPLEKMSITLNEARNLVHSMLTTYMLISLSTLDSIHLLHKYRIKKMTPAHKHSTKIPFSSKFIQYITFAILLPIYYAILGALSFGLVCFPSLSFNEQLTKVFTRELLISLLRISIQLSSITTFLYTIFRNAYLSTTIAFLVIFFCFCQTKLLIPFYTDLSSYTIFKPLRIISNSYLAVLSRVFRQRNIIFPTYPNQSYIVLPAHLLFSEINIELEPFSDHTTVNLFITIYIALLGSIIFAIDVFDITYRYVWLPCRGFIFKQILSKNILPNKSKKFNVITKDFESENNINISKNQNYSNINLIDKKTPIENNQNLIFASGVSTKEKTNKAKSKINNSLTISNSLPESKLNKDCKKLIPILKSSRNKNIGSCDSSEQSTIKKTIELNRSQLLIEVNDEKQYNLKVAYKRDTATSIPTLNLDTPYKYDSSFPSIYDSSCIKSTLAWKCLYYSTGSQSFIPFKNEIQQKKSKTSTNKSILEESDPLIQKREKGNILHKLSKTDVSTYMTRSYNHLKKNLILENSTGFVNSGDLHLFFGLSGTTMNNLLSILLGDQVSDKPSLSDLSNIVTRKALTLFIKNKRNQAKCPYSVTINTKKKTQSLRPSVNHNIDDLLNSSLRSPSLSVKKELIKQKKKSHIDKRLNKEINMIVSSKNVTKQIVMSKKYDSELADKTSGVFWNNIKLSKSKLRSIIGTDSVDWSSFASLTVSDLLFYSGINGENCTNQGYEFRKILSKSPNSVLNVKRNSKTSNKSSESKRSSKRRSEILLTGQSYRNALKEQKNSKDKRKPSYNLKYKNVKARINALIKDLDMTDIKDVLLKNIKKKSDRKKVSICAALIEDRPAYIFDISLNIFTDQEKKNIITLLKDIANVHQKIMIVSLNISPQLVVSKISTMTIFGPGGRVCYTGGVKKLEKLIDLDNHRYKNDKFISNEILNHGLENNNLLKDDVTDSSMDSTSEMSSTNSTLQSIFSVSEFDTDLFLHSDRKKKSIDEVGFAHIIPENMSLSKPTKIKHMPSKNALMSNVNNKHYFASSSIIPERRISKREFSSFLSVPNIKQVLESPRSYPQLTTGLVLPIASTNTETNHRNSLSSRLSTINTNSTMKSSSIHYKSPITTYLNLIFNEPHVVEHLFRETQSYRSLHENTHTPEGKGLYKTYKTLWFVDILNFFTNIFFHCKSILFKKRNCLGHIIMTIVISLYIGYTYGTLEISADYAIYFPTFAGLLLILLSIQTFYSVISWNSWCKKYFFQRHFSHIARYTLAYLIADTLLLRIPIALITSGILSQLTRIFTFFQGFQIILFTTVNLHLRNMFITQVVGTHLALITIFALLLWEIAYFILLIDTRINKEFLNFEIKSYPMQLRDIPEDSILSRLSIARQLYRGIMIDLDPDKKALLKIINKNLLSYLEPSWNNGSNVSRDILYAALNLNFIDRTWYRKIFSPLIVVIGLTILVIFTQTILSYLLNIKQQEHY